MERLNMKITFDQNLEGGLMAGEFTWLHGGSQFQTQ